MKLIASAVRAKDGEGTVTLQPDAPEDLWHAYNLIAVGDVLTATTVRKVRCLRLLAWCIQPSLGVAC